MHSKYDLNTIKNAARGHWRQIISSLGYVPVTSLDGEHHPCPSCGGTDRFNCDRDKFSETGQVHCNQCSMSGDGFHVLQMLNDWDFASTVKNVAEFLSVTPLEPIAPPKPPAKQKTGTTYPQAIQHALKSVRRRLPDAVTVSDEPDHVWQYQYADGSSAGAVLRWNRSDGQKEIRPLSCSTDGWVRVAMPEPRPLYCLPDIAEAKTVYISEGEKACDAIRSFGLTATTSQGGSKAASKTDWSPLAGKRVVIVPDNDMPGQDYAAKVAGLIPKPGELLIADLKDSWPEMPKAGDAHDWSAQFDSQPPDDFRDELERIARPFEIDSTSNVSVYDFKPTIQPSIVDAVPDFTPFPVHCLPRPVRDYCAAVCTSIGCDESYFAVPVLGAMAAAIGNAREIRIKGQYREPCILWTVVISESGSAKSPPQKAIKQPFEALQSEYFAQFRQERKQHKADLRQWKRDVKAWEKDGEGSEPPEPESPVCVQRIVKTATTESIAPLLADNQRGLLLGRDELSGWLNGFGAYGNSAKAAADAAAWLEWYDAEPSLINTKNGDAPCIHVERPQVSVMGTIQPSVYSKAMGGDNAENGIQARLLPCYPPYTAAGWIDSEVDQSQADEWEQFIRKLYELQPNRNELTGAEFPSFVDLSEGARSLARQFADQHAKEQEAMAGGLLKATWSKLKAACFRIALVIHCGEQVSTGVADFWQVSEDVMSRAIEIIEWWKSEVVRVHGLLAEDQSSRDARHLADWIRRNHDGRITAAKLRRYRRDINSTEAAEVSLMKLVELGCGEWQHVHKSREFVLNPL